MSERTTPNQPESLAADQKRQQAIEDFCVDRGVTRFRKAYSDAVNLHATVFHTRLGKDSIRACIEPLAEQFETFIRVAHVNNIAASVMRDMERPVLAFLTARAIIDFMAVAASRTDKRKYITVTAIASRIAEYVLDQARIERCRIAMPAVVRAKKEREKAVKTSNYNHRHRSWTALFKYLESKGTKVNISQYDLTASERHHVGATCIRLFMVALPGYIQEENLRRSRGETIKILIPTAEFMDWIEKFNAAAEGLHPVFLPTVIPPKPWSRQSDHGGYWYALADQHKLIRSKTQTKPLSDVVYQALNALQGVPWMVNKDIFDVIETARQMPSPPKGVPSYIDEDVPKRLPEDRWTAMSEEERRQERARRSDLYDKNHVRKCKRREFEAIRGIAARLLGLSMDEHSDLYTDAQGNPLPFFFPHNLDFRGRFYPIPSHLHPQGGDVCRALLKFAEGKRLGTQDAVDHLAVHGANCLGTDHHGVAIDKLPRQERIEWVHRNEGHILAAAEDWRSTMGFWAHSDVDSPFQFLAFCFEYAGYKREGLDFVSHQPVTMDGTCNGLQHIAAITRDRKLAESVNLTRSVKFNDVYGEVAKALVAVLGEWAFSEALLASATRVAEHARYWLSRPELITRSLAKRPTMTLAYGSTRRGRAMMVLDYIKDKGNAEDNVDNERIATLADALENALDRAVAGAKQLQDYLEGVVTRSGAADRLIEWIAPSGFHVVQANFEPNVQEVETHLAGGITWRLSVQEDTDESPKEMDPSAQCTGITPNVIHSIDAAHAAFVIAGSQPSVTALTSIHDCFGCHAADASFLSLLIRLYFMNIHDGEYSPQRGVDAHGNVADPHRMWSNPYSPARRLCYVRRDGMPGAEFYSEAEKAIYDGGSLLNHITHCIANGPFDRCPVDLSEVYEDDGSELLEVRQVPFDPFDSHSGIDVFLDDREERPREAAFEAERASRPKLGEYGLEEVQDATPFV